MAQSYFNQRGKTDINGKEKKAKVKTEQKETRPQEQLELFHAKAQEIRSFDRPAVHLWRRAKKDPDYPIHSISLLQLRKYILGRIIRVGGNRMAAQQHKRGGEQKKLNTISWNTLALDPSCPLKWQREGQWQRQLHCCQQWQQWPLIEDLIYTRNVPSTFQG